MTNSEVLIEGKTIITLLRMWCCRRTIGIMDDFLLGGRCHDTGLLVVSDTLLEEVGLSGERNALHEVEWVGGVIVLGVSEGQQQAVGDKLDVLYHQFGVHAEQRHRKSFRQKLALNANSLGDDSKDFLLAGTVLEVGEQEAGEVGVETFVTRDELVRERETRHKTTLLEPEDGRERSTEKDTLDSSESNQSLGERRLSVLDPLESPVGLLLDARDGLDRIEKIGTLLRVLDIGIDQERVGLGVNVLHHDLETVEAPCLGGLDLIAETLNEILIDDTIGSGEEGKDVGHKVALVIGQSVVPIAEILRQINLLGGPERSLGLLVHLPDLQHNQLTREHVTTRVCKVIYLVVLDGKEHEALLILHEQRLILLVFLDGRRQINSLFGGLEHGLVRSWGLVQVGFQGHDIVDLHTGHSTSSLRRVSISKHSLNHRLL